MTGFTYSNTTRHDGIPFDQYLALPGRSFSSLRHTEAPPETTAKMRFGSLVDAMLTEKTAVDTSDWNMVVEAGSASKVIRQLLGPGISALQTQVSYTATMHYGALQMDVKARLDFRLPNIAVIDLKVTAAKNDREFAAIINHMGYFDQLRNYAGVSGCPSAYILPYSTTAKRCLNLVRVPLEQPSDFWLEKIKLYGEVAV